MEMMTMLRGRAVGGPRNGVTIEAGSDWDGIVHKLERRLDSMGMRPYYQGRYLWEADHWQWYPGQYVRAYGPRGGKNVGNLVWINDSVSHEEREALLSADVVYIPPPLVNRTRDLVDKTVNTITQVSHRPPCADKTRVVTDQTSTRVVLDCSAGCGRPAKAWWRRTCGDPACRAQSCRQSMLARRNNPTSKAR